MTRTLTRTIWTVCPKGRPQDAEHTDTEDRAFDVAFDWSVELGGAPILIRCNGQDWAEVVA
jgi:hypothetical protein